MVLDIFIILTYFVDTLWTEK